MRPARKLGPLVFAGVLAALLLVLATLQWRALGQISANERDRMQRSLRSQVTELTQEFDRELTRAYFWLQVDRAGGSASSAGASTGHFQRWYTGAPHPAIVKSIYVVSTSPQSVRLYDREADALVAQSEVPESLVPVIERLRTFDQTTPEAGAPIFPPNLMPEGPTLVIPRPPVPVVDGGGVIVLSQEQRPWDYTVAVLDMDFIRQSLLPQLIERHFSERDGTTSYRVSIVDRQTGAQVFCSDSNTASCPIASPDASEDFVEVRMREFSRFVAVDDRRPQLSGRAPQTREHGEARGGTRMTFNVVRAEDDRRNGRGPLWRADFAHQAGSLQAVVASTRRRNLFVSSSVLLLLGTSIAMLVVSNARARKLAAQQMEFVAGVSHELRTPLAVIRSAAENLADGVVADREQVQRYGQLIATEGRRLTEMVEQVMEFAGFDAGRALDVRSVSARDVVDAAIQASQPLLAEHQVTIEVTMPEEPPYVLGNQAALSRMLVNLLSNAVKYGGADRWVGVSVGLSGRDHVVFRVSDHGAGIADQDLPHIFEPFFRGRPWTDGHVHGSGLGLSLVSRIVAQHRGKVHVDTQPDRGTTFSVTVPVARDVPATATEPAPVLPSLEAPAWKRGATS